MEIPELTQNVLLDARPDAFAPLRRQFVFDFLVVLLSEQWIGGSPMFLGTESATYFLAQRVAGLPYNGHNHPEG